MQIILVKGDFLNVTLPSGKEITIDTLSDTTSVDLGQEVSLFVEHLEDEVWTQQWPSQDLVEVT